MRSPWPLPRLAICLLALALPSPAVFAASWECIDRALETEVRHPQPMAKWVVEGLRPKLGNAVRFNDGPPSSDGGLHGGVLLENAAGDVMGAISYELHGTKLTVVMSKTNEAFQRQGIAKYLMAHILLRHPQVTEIGGELALTNLQVYIEHVTAGVAPRLAILRTPAYRIRQELGYTVVDESKTTLGRRTAYLVTRKPQR